MNSDLTGLGFGVGGAPARMSVALRVGSRPVLHIEVVLFLTAPGGLFKLETTEGLPGSETVRSRLAGSWPVEERVHLSPSLKYSDS